MQRLLRWKSDPPRPAIRLKRRVAERCQAGGAPASMTSPRLTAAKLQHHSGRSFQCIRHQRRVDTTLEALARVGDDSVAGPVSATRMGSNNAHSMNALVVRSSQPVGSPPITPAIDCTPAASAIAVLLGHDVVVAIQSPEGLVAARTQLKNIARELRHVEHVQRTARSKVKKLVMSTSVLIGRRPTEISRSCNHCGLGRCGDCGRCGRGSKGSLRGNRSASVGRLRSWVRSLRAPMAATCQSRQRRDRARCRGQRNSPAVGCDADIDQRIIKACPRCVRPDRCIFGQVDDAGMLVADSEFPF